MFAPEIRMLLRHYLQHGTSKSALARALRVSRDSIHRWMRSGDLDGGLDDTPVRYRRATCLDILHCPARVLVIQASHDQRRVVNSSDRWG